MATRTSGPPEAQASTGFRRVVPRPGSAVLWPGYVGSTALLRMPAAIVVIRLLGGT
ncbi:hypothetical protein [Nocardia sp. NPDC004722]